MSEKENCVYNGNCQYQRLFPEKCVCKYYFEKDRKIDVSRTKEE